MGDPLTEPGWRRLLVAARRSLERTGGSLDGTVSLSAPDDDERLVIIGLTGVHRPAGVGRVTVRLAEVDAHLRAAYGKGLAETLGPVRDRPGERKREALGRDAVLALAAESRHAGSHWYELWLDGLRRDGTLTRVVRGGLPFPDVVAVLDALPATDIPLPVLAERILDDTKGLTEGPVRGLVLRAIAAWHGLPAPSGAEQERALWELAGVVPDDLASQVLLLNLPAAGGVVGSWLTEAAAAHVPFRATLQQLRLAPLTIEATEIFVCENPAVLRAAAGRWTQAVVCTEGAPSAAVHELLTAVRPGAVVRWRNDFDWPGLRMTGAALRRYAQAVPWRMSAADYVQAAGQGVPLLGTPAETPWDPLLGTMMSRIGRAVMEERLLDTLLTDLTADVTRPGSTSAR
ncbi:TIGR02679 domain-containing protein [Rhizomonospora bruguierae]|uniref:TIGR02679 domain-containing protein n=1 Tax=Rhizomonospora bruguierae TaxID=1581705 RepID=UPI001BCC0274|nr:TIGR02679 domain-containing protein [Micromonospora sp. NBRC 107566]